MEILSKQFNPRVIEQTTSSVTIAWDPIPTTTAVAEVYKVEQHHKSGKWTRVYWGSESPAKVADLEENFGYVFRIVGMKFVDGVGYQPAMCSETFVGATAVSPLSTMVLFRSIKKSEQFLVKRLIKTRPSLIDLPSPNGNTPLENAIAFGENDIFDILLTAGASVHQENAINKRTPLHIAFYHGQLAMSRILVNKKANLNAPDCAGMTPSHYAVDSEQLEILRFSLENKCNIEAKDNSGWTLLHRAIVMNCNLSIIKVLVTGGCNLHSLDKNKQNCIQLASTYENREIIEYLENFIKSKVKLREPQVINEAIDEVAKIEEVFEEKQKENLQQQKDLKEINPSEEVPKLV